ncbi:MAG: hypothetical protein ACRD2Z_06230 [Thermoanaerobaculia bacterium]
MQKTLGTVLMLLVPFALAGLLGVGPAAAGTPPQTPPAEEHPEGEEAEHPEGERAEHPESEQAEHPAEEAEQQEHPAEEGGEAEHPEEAAAPAEPLTLDELADAMEAWVESESEATGTMAVDDPVTGETLQLTLDHVHRERLAHTDEQTYFACADFQAADGTLYDVDIFMEGPNAESLEATEVTVHKVNGEARYTWYEEEGIWKKRSVEG